MVWDKFGRIIAHFIGDDEEKEKEEVMRGKDPRTAASSDHHPSYNGTQLRQFFNGSIVEQKKGEGGKMMHKSSHAQPASKVCVCR